MVVNDTQMSIKQSFQDYLKQKTGTDIRSNVKQATNIPVVGNGVSKISKGYDFKTIKPKTQPTQQPIQEITQPTQQPAPSLIPKASAADLDEAKIEQFINRGKELGKSREEIKMAYDKAINDGFFDIQTEQVEQPKQPKENLPGLDVGVKLGQGISGLGKKLKFEAGNKLDESSNPFLQSISPAIEAFKFYGNIPGDVIEMAGGITETVSNPIGTAKSLETLASGLVETGLNKLFGQEYYTTEEKREVVKGVGEALKENFGTLEKAKNTIIENPADTLYAIRSGLNLAKTGIKNPNTLAKINQLDKAIDPLNILKMEAKIGGEVLGKTTGVVGKGVKKAGEALYKTSIKPNVAEAEAILKTKAGLSKAPVTRADTALKSGIIGTETQIGVQGLKKANQIFTKTIEPAFKKADTQGIKFKYEDLISKAKSNIKKSKFYSDTQKTQIIDDIDKIAKEYKGTTGLKNLDLEKQAVVGKIPKKYIGAVKPPRELTAAQNELSSVFRNTVHDTMKNEFGIKSAELYRDYANLKELSKIGIKGLTEGGLKGGFGTFWSTLYDKLATPVKTVGGQVLYRTGEGIEFVGPKGIKTVGDFIKSKGLTLKKGNILKTNLGKNDIDNNMMNSNILRNNSSAGVDRTSIKKGLKPLSPKTPKNEISNKPLQKTTKTGGKKPLIEKVRANKTMQKLGDKVDDYAEKVGAKKSLMGKEGIGADKTKMLSETDKDLISSYTKSGGGTSSVMPINKQKQVSNIINNLPENKKVVYSGQKMTIDQLDDIRYAKNDIFTTKRLISSTTDKATAEDFMRYNPKQKNEIMLEFPKGGKDITKYSLFQKGGTFKENEILFPIGQKFKVEEINSNHYKLTPIYEQSKGLKPKK